MPNRLSNPTHWSHRAEEARAVAGQFRDRETRRIMLAIADGYDRMARHAEKRLGILAPQKAPAENGQGS